MSDDRLQRSRANPGIGSVIPKGPLIALFMVSMVSNMLMLTGPLFMLQVYDRVLASRSMPTLVVLTLLVCAIYAFYAAIETMRGRMAIRIGNVIEKSLGARLVAAALYVRMTAGTPPGADPLRDSESVRQFVSGAGPMALMDLPWLPVYVALVFAIHPLLGWLAVFGAFAMALLMVANEVVSIRPSRDATIAQALRQRQADDIRNNAATVLAMGMLGDLQARWQAATADLLRVQRIAGDRVILFSSVIKGLRFLLQSAVLGLGAYLVIRGEMTGGLMIAASVVTSRALAPVEQIVGQWRGFVAARQSYARIKQMLAALPRRDRETLVPLPTSSLSVRQLATGPMGGKTALLSGISFDLQAGDALGVLGPSGSGKTSLVQALVGAWPSQAGEIRLDGTLLRHFDPAQFSGMMGYLPQRVDLFQGTVAQNIARFQPDATPADVIAATRHANIHELIGTLPNGYDTQVGEQGEALSAGQRQLVGLARALYKRPFLVVMDEPNSNLDTDGDSALTQAIYHVRERGGIVIVVAHRPSAIVAVDKLLFLRSGRQVSFGPKNEVLQRIGQAANADRVRSIKASST
jgi:ATP-binding cassette subfamily C protein PrsD